MNNFLDGVDKAKLAGAVELIKRTIGPVSYTHLDVYKRQTVSNVTKSQHRTKCA